MAPPIERASTFPVASLRLALASLDGMQPMIAVTGSTHAAAWVEPDGRISIVREDIGRHNALDKLAGAMRRQSLPVDVGLDVAQPSSMGWWILFGAVGRRNVIWVVKRDGTRLMSEELHDRLSLRAGWAEQLRRI